jgi:hypothetical protein
MSTIKSSTTTTTAYSVEADTTGALVIQTGATPTTAITVAANQSVTFAQAANLPNTFGFKNRLINSAMVIDQRNAGAVVTPANAAYTLDRWIYYSSQASKFTVEQTITGVAAPVGFTDYLGATVASAVTIGSGDFFNIAQLIEGFNISDLAWGTANAATITLSFWVRSSLTGTFGGALRNSAANRSYPFAYTISSANTWEQKTITIAGDTSGTWLTNNGVGVTVAFGLGVGSSVSGTAGAWAGANLLSATGATSVVGTNGATFYITGVQLEKGSTATSFDYRPYGTELALCQRYLPTANSADYYTGLSATTFAEYSTIKFPVTARVAPTGISVSSVTGYTTTNGGGSPIAVTAISFSGAGVNAAVVRFDVASGLTVGQASLTAIGTAPLLFTGCEL